ncbi:type IV pilin N-terminal domain-containing protein [Methanoculleus horonobensis]|uniref:type IV pilin N-terminal domain-containing protein n=1 Tax=Methanoculleus horonobensis TaxID=528314 RepID=UPI000831B96C|nr:type IV pilin N-terminal domain-containing protein [Methanoculleus horonobensis]
MQQHPGEEGVSEMVGAMLLLGLTVIGVVLVGIVFLSDSRPDAIPHAAIAAGMNETDRLILVHEGGDPLRAGEYRIYVDTGSGLTVGTDSFTGHEDGAWSVGKSLVYNGTGTPERVVVTAISGGSETVLAEPEFRGGTERFSPDPVRPGVMVTPGSGDDEDTSPVWITTPETGQGLAFSGTGNGNNRHATMVAQTTLEDVTRVDFIVYQLDEPYSNEKESMMRNVQTNASAYYVWDNIPTMPGLSNGDKVAMIAIVYNGDAIIGCSGVTTTVSGL